MLTFNPNVLCVIRDFRHCVFMSLKLLPIKPESLAFAYAQTGTLFAKPCHINVKPDLHAAKLH